jgi:hypothetical protein
MIKSDRWIRRMALDKGMIVVDGEGIVGFDDKGRPRLIKDT